MKKFALVITVMFIAATAFAAEMGMGKPAPADKPAEPKPPALKLKVGDSMIDFELKDVNGKTVKTADLRKGKALVFRFTSSTHKNAEMQVSPMLKAVEKYGDKIVVIDIAVKEPLAKDQLLAYNKEQKKTWTTLLDADGAVADKYGAPIPTLIIVDLKGKIAGQSAQYVHWANLEPVLDDILGIETK